MTQVTTARRRRARPAEETPRPTREQQVSRGKAARSEVPRASHAEFTAGPDRPDAVSQLESQAAVRVPELLPIRYGRMAVSAFTFFRGAALPMARDLAGTPRTGLLTQICGDAHLANFGVFGSPERNLVFDINDFDETLPGPWEWDVKRLAASLEIAGRDNGFRTKERRQIVLSAVADYRIAMREFAHRPSLEVWYTHASAATLTTRFASELDKAGRKKLSRNAGQGADQGQPRRPRSLHRRRRRPTDDHRSAAADRAAARARR